MSGERQVKIAASILSADFSRLGEQVQELERAGADWIHIDVMDGHFVPNLTIGPPVIAAIRPLTTIPFDVHLMIESPESSLADYVRAGADRLTVHVETCPHLHRTVEQIRELGALPGVSLNPGTPVSALDAIIGCVELVLVMSVNPGFGGQAYISGSTGRIQALNHEIADAGASAELEVDGGINDKTIQEVVRAGASVLVIGSALFSHSGTLDQRISQLRKLIDECADQRLANERW